MNRQLTVTAAMITVLLAAGACSPASAASPATDASIEVTIDDFANTQQVVRQVEVAEGGILTVTLGSNPTTGFSWTEDARISDPTVLLQSEIQRMPALDPDLIGAPGSQVWTFEALQKGTTIVSMDYGRPWEGGEKGVWTFELTVTVK